MITSAANIETAMCLWEAVQDGLRNGVNEPLYHALIEEAGTVAARHAVMAWIEECETEWKAVEEEYTQAFDWEFVPAFVARKLQERFPDLVTA